MENVNENIYNRFLKITLRYTNKIAIKYEAQSINYSDLLALVDNYANGLKNYKQQKIALYLPLSIEFIAIILACLKINAAYIPLDVNYPQQHLENILQDSKPQLLIADKELSQKLLTNMDFIFIKDLNKIHKRNNQDKYSTANPDTDAYIIYTSGSTGKPKGVVITHNNLLALLTSTDNLYKISDSDNISVIHSVAFDFSVWEIFSGLLNGAKITLFNREKLNSLDDYFNFIKKNKITILNITPPLFYLLLEKIYFTKKNELRELPLRLIILGGTNLQPLKLKRWFNLSISIKTRIFNMYGITEGTIHSTYIEVDKEMANSAASVIGKSLSHVKIKILDNNGHYITEPQKIGELCLSGSSVAKGYLNEPSLSSERFYIDEEGDYIFKTGDLVKLNENDNYEYIGRKDNQLKIRGFRIDPNEIENALLSLENIKNALVISINIKNREPKLIAFIEANQNDISEFYIKETLKKILPDYMLPNEIIFKDHLSLNINGKIDQNSILSDYKKLPEKNKAEISTNTIISIWESVLDKKVVDLNTNFFDLGGDSLLLMKLHLKIQNMINRNIKLIDIVANPSINSFQKFLKEKVS